MQHPPESCGNPSRPLNPHSDSARETAVSFVGSSVAKNDNGVYLEEERGPLGIAEHLDVPEEEEEAERNLEHPQVDREQRVVARADALHEEGGLDEEGEEENISIGRSPSLRAWRRALSL